MLSLSPMSLHTDIRGAIKDALKAKEEVRLRVLRSLSTAFTNELVAAKRKPDEELEDDAVLAVITREAKKRKDSIEQFTKGDRKDLADIEAEELVVIEEFLPEMMSEEEIRKIAEAKKEELGVTDKSGMGQLMGAIMKETKGKADGADVKKVVDSLL